VEVDTQTGRVTVLKLAAAVANAIEDATGARVTQLPLTPERVARARGLVEDRGPRSTR